MRHPRFSDVNYTTASPQSNAEAKLSKGSKKAAVRWMEFNRLVEDIGPTLSPSEFQVLVAIFKRADAKTRIAKVSHESLSKMTSVKRRQILRLVQALISKGHISVVRKGCSVTNQPSQYRYKI